MWSRLPRARYGCWYWSIWAETDVYAYGVGLWLPSMIRSVSGVSNLFFDRPAPVIPYVATAIAMVVIGMHSDHTCERRWHLAGPAFAGAISLALGRLRNLQRCHNCLSQPFSFTLAGGLFHAGSILGDLDRTAERNLGRGGIALITRFGNLRVPRALHHRAPGSHLDRQFSGRAPRRCGAAGHQRRNGSAGLCRGSAQRTAEP